MSSTDTSSHIRTDEQCLMVKSRHLRPCSFSKQNMIGSVLAIKICFIGFHAETPVTGPSRQLFFLTWHQVAFSVKSRSKYTADFLESPV